MTMKSRSSNDLVICSQSREGKTRIYSQINNVYKSDRGKFYSLFIFLYFFFLLKLIKCDKLLHFMKKIKYFASNYGVILDIKIELCK